MNWQADANPTLRAYSSEQSLRFEIRRPRHRIEIPAPGSDVKSVLAFSLHKAGSTMLNDILRAICPAASLTFVSYQDELFLGGFEPETIDVRADFPETGYCFGGFRNFPGYPIPILETAKAILLVRDPRDVLVSRYFSDAYSHIIPEPDGRAREKWILRREKARSMSIDDWVLDARGSYVADIKGYLAQQFATRTNVAIYRYEDVIFRKRAWIDDIADWYGWDVPEQLAAHTARSVDIFPAAVDPTKHVRQVAPGNHKTVLQQATREKLNTSFSDLLSLFRYPLQ